MTKTHYKLPIILKYCSLLLDTYNAQKKNASIIYLDLLAKPVYNLKTGLSASVNGAMRTMKSLLT